MPDIDLSRLPLLPPLSKGAHEGPEAGACVMEAVAYVAGEPWSDSPECASGTISTFLRSWNDALPEVERDALLRPLVPRLVGTRGDEATERRRSFMAFDWLVRVQAAAWLRRAGLVRHADALSSLPELADAARIEAAQMAIAAARDAAWDAARGAARVAARGAARAAAGDAARGAAWDALAPTVAELQRSALALIDRMIAAGDAGNG